MDSSQNRPLPETPVLFNALKHHLPTLKKFISNPPPHWKNELFVIGHSLIDLYVGDMSVSAIIQETIQALHKLNVLNLSNYESWLESANGYRIIHLSDGSKWTLRRSRANDVQYIHIHPARNSLHTIRVKSETLKTAIAFHCLKYYRSLHSLPCPDDKGFTETLNYVRQQIELSPIKKAEKRSKIFWLIQNLHAG